MAYQFTREELSFLLSEYRFDDLEGFSRIDFDRDACIAGLSQRGVLTPYRDGGYELAGGVRLLLSAWKNIRYTLVSDAYITEDHVFQFLVSSRSIIVYSEEKDDIRLDICDFSPETMDGLIADYLQLSDVAASTCYNITLSAEEFATYLGADEGDNARVARALGLPADEFASLKRVFGEQDVSFSYITQDVEKDVGCLGLLYLCEDGYLLLKHITPQREEDERFVLVKGGKENIVDSVYIL